MRTLTASILLLASLPFFANANTTDVQSDTFIAKVEIEKSGKPVTGLSLPLLPNQGMESSTVIAFNQHLKPTHGVSAEHNTNGQSSSASIWLTADSKAFVVVNSAECGTQQILSAVSKNTKSSFSMESGECVVSVSLDKLTANATHLTDGNSR